jgi:hypothetical protein
VKQYNSKALLLLGVALFIGWHLLHAVGCDPLITRPRADSMSSEPVITSNDPLQTPYSPSSPDEKPLVLNRAGIEYNIHPVANYSISGRVVSRRRYYSGWDYGLAADLSPVDFALVWGDLAKTQMDRFISYDHGQRFFHYHYKNDIPVTADYIISHSSNNHLIPATPKIDRAIKTVKAGELVQVDGYLVNVDAHTQGGGFMSWSTSLTRTDTGGGACELIYVTQLKIGNSIYR